MGSREEKHLERAAALPALPGWDGNVSPGADSQAPGFGCKPPRFSIPVFVLALLLIFNSVGFISDSNSDLSPFLPLAGTSFPGLAPLQIDPPRSRVLLGQVRQRFQENIIAVRDHGGQIPVQPPFPAFLALIARGESWKPPRRLRLH